MKLRPMSEYLWSFEATNGDMHYWEIKFAPIEGSVYHGSAQEIDKGLRIPWFAINLDTHERIVESIQAAIRRKFYPDKDW